MSSSNLIRLGALAAVTAGALLLIGELLYLVVGLSPDVENLATTSSVVQNVVFLLGFVLLLGGLVALYGGRSETLGTLGLAGFLAAFLGTTSFVGLGWLNAFAVPSVAERAPELLEPAPPPLVFVSGFVSGVLFSLGWLLLGLAALRARAYPRWATVLLVVGAVLAFVSLPFTYVPFGVAVAWMDFSLLSVREDESGASALPRGHRRRSARALAHREFCPRRSGAVPTGTTRIAGAEPEKGPERHTRCPSGARQAADERPLDEA